MSDHELPGGTPVGRSPGAAVRRGVGGVSPKPVPSAASNLGAGAGAGAGEGAGLGASAGAEEARRGRPDGPPPRIVLTAHLTIPLSSTRHLGADEPEWLPCSDRSRERDDPLFATGSRGLQWLLVEIDGAWGANAFTSSALGRPLGQLLVSRIEAAGMRPLAIRRTGRRAERLPPGTPPRWRWAFVDSRPGFEDVRWGEVDAPHELLEVPLDGSTGIHSAQPIYAVCTHAKHDRCCAVRGRPVVGALAAAFPEETWECSHLGGDRFAGTMVLLPEGLYYGRVGDADAVEVARLAREGRVAERFLRGRSSLSHPVQAAQHFARERFGDDRLVAWAPVGERAGEGDGVTVVTLAAAPTARAPVPEAAPTPRREAVAGVPDAIDPEAGVEATAEAGAAAGPHAGGGDSPSAGEGEGAGEGVAAGERGGAGVLTEGGDSPSEGAVGALQHKVVIVVAEKLSQPLLSTCGATRFGRVREFALVSLTVSAS